MSIAAPNLATGERERVPRPVIEAVSVVVPAYNEEHTIGRQIQAIERVMTETARPYELIIVDDGSTDGTAREVEQHGARLIRLPYNRGYGAALKAGLSAAQNEWIVITDADGTYPSEAIPAMLERAPDYDMVVGARLGENVHIPLLRRPAKWFLGKLASYLAEQPIPDLNSGLRVMKKSLLQKYWHLLPAGFSFTTTITLALLCNHYRVHYHPIDYHKRGGQSKIRMRHAYDFLLVILRTVIYFNPLRVFLPAGAVLFLPGLGKFIYDVVVLRNLTDSAVMGLLGGVLVWSVGLLADQMSRIAMALHEN